MTTVVYREGGGDVTHVLCSGCRAVEPVAPACSLVPDAHGGPVPCAHVARDDPDPFNAGQRPVPCARDVHYPRDLQDLNLDQLLAEVGGW